MRRDSASKGLPRQQGILPCVTSSENNTEYDGFILSQNRANHTMYPTNREVHHFQRNSISIGNLITTCRSSHDKIVGEERTVGDNGCNGSFRNNKFSACKRCEAQVRPYRRGARSPKQRGEVSHTATEGPFKADHLIMFWLCSQVFVDEVSGRKRVV